MEQKCTHVRICTYMRMLLYLHNFHIFANHSCCWSINPLSYTMHRRRYCYCFPQTEHVVWSFHNEWTAACVCVCAAFRTLFSCQLATCVHPWVQLLCCIAVVLRQVGRVVCIAIFLITLLASCLHFWMWTFTLANCLGRDAIPPNARVVVHALSGVKQLVLSVNLSVCLSVCLLAKR